VSTRHRNTVSPLARTFLTTVSRSAVAKAGKFRVEESVQRSVTSGVDDVVGDDDVAAATLRSLCNSEEQDQFGEREKKVAGKVKEDAPEA
jgi:hypothetical protein